MSVVEVLESFLEVMLAWEISLNAKKRTHAYNEDAVHRDQVNADARQALNIIFERYLTERAIVALGKAKLSGLGTGRPPEYQQDVLPGSLVMDGASVSIETVRNRGFKQRFKYVFVESDDGLRLNKLYICRGQQEGWVRRQSI